MPQGRRLISGLVTARTTKEMLAIAGDQGALLDGRIDLRGSKIRFDHEGLDLRRFVFEATDLSGSILRNCQAPGVSFSACQMKRVRITAEKGTRSSFVDASFDGAIIDGAHLGPATLDLARSSFRRAMVTATTFMLGHLESCDFSGAHLRDVMLRSARLDGAMFRGAVMERVSLERAILSGADFSDVEFVQMEEWGEPDFSGATISDDLRYSFGIVSDPVRKIDRIVRACQFSDSEMAAITRFQAAINEFASSAPEVMLIGHEYGGVISLALFARLMKAMKQLQESERQ